MNKNDFVVGVLTYIACLREKRCYSTAKSYQDALNSFKRFCGLEEIPYVYINKDTLVRYQSWLLAKGCSRNTVSTISVEKNCALAFSPLIKIPYVCGC